VIGSEVTERVPDEIRTFINGELRCRASIADLVRPIDRLIADIGEFLTLQPGDILLIGEPHDAPLARAGDRVRVEIDGLAPIENEVVAE
jgi:5-oxopent-3-ene-1,2,5-tricarboxylate decarboxylase/2-hydroxyhepta-2,4-diene-1,7-dioate isomerase